MQQLPFWLHYFIFYITKYKKIQSLMSKKLNIFKKLSLQSSVIKYSKVTTALGCRHTALSCSYCINTESSLKQRTHKTTSIKYIRCWLTSKILKDSSQVDRRSYSYAVFRQAPLDVAQHAPHREDDPGLGGPGRLSRLLLSSSAGHDSETATSVRLCRDTLTIIHQLRKLLLFFLVILWWNKCIRQNL